MLKDFGQDLKSLRESKNITIAEIASQTRINPKFIVNMEEGQFDFQPDTYIRAFLKEYARCINENEDKLLSDYSRAKGGFYSKKKPASEIKEQPVISIKPVEPANLKSQKAKQQIADEIDEEFRKKAPPKKKEIYTGPDPDQEMLERESRKRYSKWSKKRKIVTAIIVFICILDL